MELIESHDGSWETPVGGGARIASAFVPMRPGLGGPLALGRAYHLGPGSSPKCEFAGAASVPVEPSFNRPDSLANGRMPRMM